MIYCEYCKRKVEYCVSEEQLESMKIEDIEFECIQKHAYCRLCGEEIWPGEIFDFNVKNAHIAYCRKAGIEPVDHERREKWNDLRDKVYIYWQTQHDFSLRDLEEYALSQTDDPILASAVITDFIEEFVAPL